MIKGRAYMKKNAVKDFNRKIGYRIYLRRKILKYTQKNIAEALDTSFQCVQKYESGKTALSIYNLYRLSQFLDVDLDYFFQDINTEKQTIKASTDQGNDLRWQNLLKDFTNIKDRKIARKIEDLISFLGNG